MRQTKSTRDSILTFIEAHGSTTTRELTDHLGITRQAINLHMRELISSGQVIKTGSTRASRYFPRSAAPVARVFSQQFELKGLQEFEVYERISITLNLKQLRPNVESIFHYAFTEILNNAIDHSKATRCHVEVRLEANSVGFEIRDGGIGVFYSIADKHGLPDEQMAMIELIKGKTTTMPEAHSGEGIFFVSRAAEKFSLRSHRIQMDWDRKLDDVFVSEPRFRNGTTVIFKIQNDSRTRLEAIFEEYAPEAWDFQFQKTRVLVKLLQSDYVSRSEAKRLMHNLDRFSEVELDMRSVKHVGQGFADEIFRVFNSKHPNTEVRVINAGKNVTAMIRHVGEKYD